MIDINLIRFKYDCNYVTGEVFSIEASGKRNKINSFGSDDYGRAKVDGKTILLHRLIWAHYYREQPPEVIDHIDRNTLNNSISNLRVATANLNQANRKISRNNTSGFTGVSFVEKTRKWKAVIYINCEQVYLGVYETAELASQAYKTRKESVFNIKGLGE